METPVSYLNPHHSPYMQHNATTSPLSPKLLDSWMEEVGGGGWMVCMDGGSDLERQGL